MTDLPVAVGFALRRNGGVAGCRERVLELLEEAFSRFCLRKQAHCIVPIGDQRRNARNRRLAGGCMYQRAAVIRQA
jgi:hypothetical protein